MQCIVLPISISHHQSSHFTQIFPVTSARMPLSTSEGPWATWINGPQSHLLLRTCNLPFHIPCSEQPLSKHTFLSILHTLPWGFLDHQPVPLPSPLYFPKSQHLGPREGWQAAICFCLREIHTIWLTRLGIRQGRRLCLFGGL